MVELTYMNNKIPVDYFANNMSAACFTFILFPSTYVSSVLQNDVKYK